jgi:hypothetical protein
MIQFWKAIKRYWYIPILAIGGFLAWIFFCRWRPGTKITPLATTFAELEAIRAGVEADKVRIELGQEEAIKHVKEKYAERFQKLTKEQKERAQKLEADPEALARYIVLGTKP